MDHERSRRGFPWLPLGTVATLVAALGTVYGVWRQNPSGVRRDLDQLSQVTPGDVLALAGLLFLLYLARHAWRMLRRCALSGELPDCVAIWVLVAGYLYVVAHATPSPTASVPLIGPVEPSHAYPYLSQIGVLGVLGLAAKLTQPVWLPVYDRFYHRLFPPVRQRP